MLVVSLGSSIMALPGVSAGGCDCFHSRFLDSCSVFHGMGSSVLLTGAGASSSSSSCITATFDFFSLLLVHSPESPASVRLRLTFFLSVDTIKV